MYFGEYWKDPLTGRQYISWLSISGGALNKLPCNIQGIWKVGWSPLLKESQQFMRTFFKKH